MKQLTSAFTKYELTIEEELNGQILNQLQILVIQNELCMIAEQILALEYNPDKPLGFVQQEAFLKGQLGVLQGFLDASIQAREKLETLAKQST